MTLSVWFWLFYVLSIVFAVWREYAPGPYPWYKGTWYLVFYIMLGLLGWKVFGPPVQ